MVMLRYAFNPLNRNHVKVYGRGLRISGKDSKILCGKINGRQLAKAKAFLERLVEQKQNLEGKYYTKASGELLELLKSAENNAEFKGLDAERLVVIASVHKGFRYMRPRRFKMRRQQRKVTNVQVVLQQK
jgi:large subunit ribosomal protein L22